MAIKKKSTKKKTTKAKTSWNFILNGKVTFEERIGNKVISSADIDGKDVLQILANAFEEGVKAMLDKKMKLSDFLREIEAEAKNEGPDAVKELRAFRKHFRAERNKIKKQK
jgi:hypothetical protein